MKNKIKIISIFGLILVFTLFNFVSALNCSSTSFFNNVDLNSGKIAYPLAYGVYYTESPCYPTNLNGNISVHDDFNAGENNTIYYPGSTKIGIISLGDNQSLFYKYNDSTLTKAYVMADGANYVFSTIFNYQDNKLSSTVSSFAGGDVTTSFLINDTQIKVTYNGHDEIYSIVDDKIVQISQNNSFGNFSQYTDTSFYYTENQTYVVQAVNNQVVKTIYYDLIDGSSSPVPKNTSCFDFDEKLGFANSLFSASSVFSKGAFSYDTCETNASVREYYCGINFLRFDFWNAFSDKVVKSTVRNCEYGCENGACLNSPSTQTIPLTASILIHNCQELQNMQNNLTARYELANDIDCSETKNWNCNDLGQYCLGFRPVGAYTHPFTGLGFSGNFEGNNHTISNLNIGLFPYRSRNFIGLFGASIGNISNVGLVNVSFSSYDTAGGLVGVLQGGLISNSYVSGNLSSIVDCVGGLVGQQDNGIIYHSYSTANVNGISCVGGLVGNFNDGIINNSYSTGLVEVIYDLVGGLVGTQCYGKIFNSYSVGKVNGTSYVGGLVGLSHGENGFGVCTAVINNSHWDIQTSGQLISDGGEGNTTAQMKQQSTYVSWDFNNIWAIDGSTNEGYPYLQGFDWTASPFLDLPAEPQSPNLV